MIWLTWRQFRTQAVVAVVALAAFAIVLAVTGPRLARRYEGSGIATCRAGCGALADSFLKQAMSGTTGMLFYLGVGVTYVLPALIGIFWGAPLIARELEAGTYRLVWNQSVTRKRWLAAKLLGVGLASMTTAGLLSLVVSWWADPIDKVSPETMTPEVFGARGIVPIGYAAFAFAVGVTAGLLIRRTLPAMATTLAIVVGAQIAMALWIRGYLISPVRASLPLDSSSLKQFFIDSDRNMEVTGTVDVPGAWVVSNRTVTGTGQLFTGPADPIACQPYAGPRACAEWVGSLHLKQLVAYQPGSRFWALQWYETTIFLAIATLLAGVCFWWVRRRLI